MVLALLPGVTATELTALESLPPHRCHSVNHAIHSYNSDAGFIISIIYLHTLLGRCQNFKTLVRHFELIHLLHAHCRGGAVRLPLPHVVA